MDAAAMMGGGMGASARMYGAAASPRPGANGLQRGGMPKSGSASELCDNGLGPNSGGGQWVQIMDPDGKVYLVNQAAGGAGGGNQ